MNTHMRSYRVGSVRVLSTGPSVPLQLGCATLWYVVVFTNLEAPQTLYFEDFYESVIIEAGLIINSISSHLEMAWSFGDQSPPRSPPIFASLERKTLLSLGKL